MSEIHVGAIVTFNMANYNAKDTDAFITSVQRNGGLVIDHMEDDLNLVQAKNALAENSTVVDIQTVGGKRLAVVKTRVGQYSIPPCYLWATNVNWFEWILDRFEWVLEHEENNPKEA